MPATSRPGGGPAPRSRGVATTALALACLLVLAACGGGGEKTARGEATGGASASADASAGSAATPATPEKSQRPKPRFGLPAVGDCHFLSASLAKSAVDTTRPVRCERRHNSVVSLAKLVRKPVTVATPLRQQRLLATRLCGRALPRIAGGTPAQRATTILGWSFFIPSRDQTERGARWVRCDVVARTRGQLVPLPSTRPLLSGGVPDELRACQTSSGYEVSCSQRHAFRVDDAFPAPPGGYPTSALTRTARARCQQLTGRQGGFWQPPSRAEWRQGDRWIRCLSRASSS